jgi:PAS domain S-box-containing protein
MYFRMSKKKVADRPKFNEDSSQTDEKLRTHFFLNSLIENLPYMIFVKDAEDLKFIRFNRAGEELIGLPREAMIGKSDYDFFPKEQADFFIAHDREVLRSGKLKDIAEEPIQTVKNGTRYLHTKKIPILSANGTPKYLLGISEDITEKKLAEERQERAAETERLYREAQALNHVKDEFLAVLSHELRTPLSVICGHAELLVEESQNMREAHLRDVTASPAPTRMLSSAQAIYRNARLQTQIIDDLLDISSIIIGKMKFHPERICAKEILQAQAEIAIRSASERDEKIEVNIEQGDAYLLADPTRLSQMVSNLLSNAIKFTPSGGTTSLRGFREDDKYVIQVQDTGCGIEPSFLPYVFDRFRQEDASITRRFGGLGLGLSIVRQLADMHHGSVEAFSKGKNQGSLFTIKIPLADSVRVAQTEISPDRPHAIDVHCSDSGAGLMHLNGVKILLVDDSEDSRALVERLLLRSGANVVSVASPGAAREAMLINFPDVIVSDIGMPDEDGYTFIKKLREDQYTKAIPAIAMTAYVRGEEIERALDSGFQAHVAKPASYRIVVDTVRRILVDNHH